MERLSEKIKDGFTIKLEREGYSIYVKLVTTFPAWEKNVETVNEILSPSISKILCIGKPAEQILLTRSDKVEVSVLRAEGNSWEWELCVFNDVKGKVVGALKNDPFQGMERAANKEAALERAVELLMIV